MYSSRVVNDQAERGVALIEEFSGHLTKDEEQLHCSSFFKWFKNIDMLILMLRRKRFNISYLILHIQTNYTLELICVCHVPAKKRMEEITAGRESLSEMFANSTFFEDYRQEVFFFVVEATVCLYCDKNYCYMISRND